MRQLYAKILDLSGNVIARLSPNYQGDAAGIETVEVASINGEDVIGTSTVDLHKVTDPAFHFQRDIQRAIKKQYRIEHYSTPTFRGTPEWTGVIVSNPSDGSMRLDCNDASQRLAQRNTRRYETLNGNAATVAQNLLGTHNTVVLWDDFATNLSKWSVTTGWTIGSGVITATSAGGGNLESPQKAAAYCGDVQLWIDLKIPENGNYSIYFPYQAASDHCYYATISSLGSNEGAPMQITIFHANAGVYTSLATRDFAAPPDQFLHFVVFYSTSGTSHTMTVEMNDFELISATHTDATINASGSILLTLSGSGDNYYADNFLWLSKANALTAGTFDATSETLTDQETSGMSQRDALNWIANKLGWEWRVNPASGEGNDTVDFGANIGYDWTQTPVVFKETEDKDYPFRIIRCQRNDASEELATVLHTFGQRSDDPAGSFVSVDLAAIATYGIIEGQFSDERIIDCATAKVVSDVELAKRSGNTPSYSFTLVDETKLYEQEPMGGYAIAGDAIAGGRTKLRAGDTIAVSSESLDLFKEELKILSLRRQSGTNEVEVTCEYRPWTRQRARQRLEDQLQRAIREAYLRMDTQSLTFALSGTTPQTQSFSIQGNYRGVQIHINSASWAGGVAIKLDGVDRTVRWFGLASVTANASAREKVMSFLYASLSPGVHTITMTPTQTVTMRVEIRPEVRG